MQIFCRTRHDDVTEVTNGLVTARSLIFPPKVVLIKYGLCRTGAIIKDTFAKITIYAIGRYILIGLRLIRYQTVTLSIQLPQIMVFIFHKSIVTRQTT